MKRRFLGLLLMCISLSIVSAQYRLTGKVLDENGYGLPGAYIKLNDDDLRTISNSEGNYEIGNIKSGEYIVSVAYMGFQTLEKPISIYSDLKLNLLLQSKLIMTDEVLVTAIRAEKNTPLAYTNLSKSELQKNNLGQDLPILLSLTPSVVVSSDAGAGVGYTGIRIRGTDASRINITLNGIPLNDAESHGVWWVNMPDIVSSVENIQIQRGVGTSSNGSGAFGASINMQSDGLEPQSYGEVSTSLGSFNTKKVTLKAGSGLLQNHWAFDGRFSNISSDGYVDRASSDLVSTYFSGGYYAANTIVKAVYFAGHEKTYQAWYGVPKVRLEDDQEGMLRYKDDWLWSSKSERVNQIKYDELIASNSRTYNYYTYDNETDNYWQDNAQLLFSQKINTNLHFNAALHYTHGQGYYESLKLDGLLEDFGLNQLIVNGQPVDMADLVLQKWLNNDFYGFTSSIKYNINKLDVILGGGWNKYDGHHYGYIIPSAYSNTLFTENYEWYRGTGKKTDLNAYLKVNYQLGDHIHFFTDLQYRKIEHDLSGIDDDLRNISQNHKFEFFNPKAGLFFDVTAQQKLFASVGIASREPNRSNYTDANPSAPAPVWEKLVDYEMGYQFNGSIFQVAVNGFYMDYKDQLVLTGQINDVGSAVMTNVPQSYRAGVELIGAVKLTSKLTLQGNATFSKNKIKSFVEYVDNWDTWESDATKLGDTDLSFSPSLTGSASLTYHLNKNIDLGYFTNYVGRQFIDNTSNHNNQLDAYWLNNFKADFTFMPKWTKKVKASLLVNNIFGEVYESNGWVYSYNRGGMRYTMDGYFPQAGRNFLVGLTLLF